VEEETIIRNNQSNFMESQKLIAKSTSANPNKVKHVELVDGRNTAHLYRVKIELDRNKGNNSVRNIVVSPHEAPRQFDANRFVQAEGNDASPSRSKVGSRTPRNNPIRNFGSKNEAPSKSSTINLRASKNSAKSVRQSLNPPNNSNQGRVQFGSKNTNLTLLSNLTLVTEHNVFSNQNNLSYNNLNIISEGRHRSRTSMAVQKEVLLNS